MKTTFKKVLSTLSIAALVVASSSYNVLAAGGAAISVASADRTTFTLNLPAGVDLAAGDTITLTVKNATTDAAIDLSSNDVTALTVDSNNELAQVTNNGDANGQIVVTSLVSNAAAGGDVSFTLTSALSDNTAYSVTYVDSQGNFGEAMINFGTANQVVVTANVVPMLSLSLSTANLSLGTLSTSAYQSASVNVTTASNAVNGVTVSLASAGLKDSVIGREIGVADIAGGVAQTTASDYYKVSTNAIPVFTDVNASLSAAGGTDMSATQNVLIGTNVTDSNVTTKVTVGSKIGATTEAGNYSDTLTFTATGSF